MYVLLCPLGCGVLSLYRTSLGYVHGNQSQLVSSKFELYSQSRLAQLVEYLAPESFMATNHSSFCSALMALGRPAEALQVPSLPFFPSSTPSQSLRRYKQELKFLAVNTALRSRTILAPRKYFLYLDSDAVDPLRSICPCPPVSHNPH